MNFRSSSTNQSGKSRGSSSNAYRLYASSMISSRCFLRSIFLLIARISARVPSESSSTSVDSSLSEPSARRRRFRLISFSTSLSDTSSSSVTSPLSRSSSSFPRGTTSTSSAAAAASRSARFLRPTSTSSEPESYVVSSALLLPPPAFFRFLSSFSFCFLLFSSPSLAIFAASLAFSSFLALACSRKLS